MNLESFSNQVCSADQLYMAVRRASGERKKRNNFVDKLTYTLHKSTSYDVEPRTIRSMVGT